MKIGYTLNLVFSLLILFNNFFPTYSQPDVNSNMGEQKIELSLAYGLNYIFLDFNSPHFDQHINNSLENVLGPYTANLISAELLYRFGDKTLIGISYCYDKYNHKFKIGFSPDTVNGEVIYDLITDFTVNYNSHRIFGIVAYSVDWSDIRLLITLGLGTVFLSYEEDTIIETASDPIVLKVSSDDVGFGLLLKPKVSYFIEKYISFNLAAEFAINHFDTGGRSNDLSSKSLGINAGISIYF